MTVEIDQAFTKAVVNGGLDIDIVHENGLYSVWGGSSYTHHDGVYTPDANREYCEIKLFPSDRVAFSLNHSDVEVGFFQVILKYPNDSGSHTIKVKADEVLDLFKIGSILTYGSQTVNIDSKRRDGGRNENGFYQIVARVSYRAFIDR